MRALSRRSRTRRRGVCCVLAACAAAMMTACTAVDTFAPAAMDYNLQAEEIRDQTILLNIVRAAYRKPMQFSDFTTVTGLTSASVTAAFALPFAAIPGSVARTFAAMPSGTLTGGPNFTVSILNTKEFYSGIMQPISLQTITLYLRQGFPKEILLPLLLSDIEYKRNGVVIHAYNGVDATIRSGEQRTDFRTLLRQLIDRGIDTEEVDQTMTIGPLLTEKDVSSLGTLAGLPQGESLVKYDGSTNDENLSGPERAELGAKGIKTYFRLEKMDASYRFCFDSNSAEVGRPIANTDLTMNSALVCGAAANVRALAPPVVQGARGAPRQIHALVFGALGAAPAPHPPVGIGTRAAPSRSRPGYRETPPPNPGTAAASPVAGQELTMTTRSVEQLIYYLGEIARAQLGLTGPPKPCPMVATGAGSVCLFRLSSGPAPAGAISAAYDGTNYAIAVDPTGKDRSSQILELVSQLLALNNSAKDLPAPSIIPVIR